MNIYLIIILITLFLEFFLYNLSRFLDLRTLNLELPPEFNNYYSKDKYAKSQHYLKDNIMFSYYTSTFNLILILIIIFSGLFNYFDLWLRTFELSSITRGLLFFGILFFVQDIISTPFSIYKTFIIEEKYGFNKTSPLTYLLDKIKSYAVIIIFGGIILYLILYFFENMGNFSWIFAWLILSAFMIAIQPIFTLFIAPIFNSFTPLEEGSLKQKINNFVSKIDFPLARIDVMDGSKRSSKSNAYFSGLGKNKRIALFDTLIKNHTDDELLSIIAHEVGHYKKHHNIKGIVIGILQTGLLFYLLSQFINNELLFAVFKMQNLSIYASLLFFSILYSPIDLCISVFSNYMSRKHEFEADNFAKESIGTSDFLIEGLKKLTVSNLGNLTPHPFTVILNYSHPPVIQRINALKKNE